MLSSVQKDERYWIHVTIQAIHQEDKKKQSDTDPGLFTDCIKSKRCEKKRKLLPAPKLVLRIELVIRFLLSKRKCSKK